MKIFKKTSYCMIMMFLSFLFCGVGFSNVCCARGHVLKVPDDIEIENQKEFFNNLCNYNNLKIEEFNAEKGKKYRINCTKAQDGQIVLLSLDEVKN